MLVSANPSEGLVILFTGLPASGKTTLATELLMRLQCADCKATMLDGDDFRSKISPELGFSAPDRSANLKRARIIAAEIVRHGGITICSFIAPYERDRLEFRKAIEEFGRFILVHLSTPLSVCERRDPKGLYAKAKSGLIRNFTGVSDKYEEPGACEIKIDTANMTVDEALDSLIQQLAQITRSVKLWLAYGKSRNRSAIAADGDAISTQSEDRTNRHRLFQGVLELLAAGRISINEAASALNTGRHTIERTVRSVANLTFRDLQQTLMLQRAKTLLAEGRSIKDVAFVLGFRSPQTFHRFFMKTSGTTPSSIQQQGIAGNGQ